MTNPIGTSLAAKTLALGAGLLGAVAWLGCQNDEPPAVSVWTVYHAPDVGANSLRALAATGARDVWAVGAYGMVLHYDGLAWKREAEGLTRQDLNGVVMFNPSGGWAVGDGGIILRRSGGQWFNAGNAGPEDLHGIAALGEDLIFAVGDAGAIYRFNGQTWSKDNSGVTVDLRAVAAAAEGTAYAVGDAGTILRFDGSSWKKQNAPSPARLNDVGEGPGGIYAVGDYGVILVNDGSGWKNVSSPTLQILNGFGAAADGEPAFVVGNNNVLLAYDTGDWAPVDIELDPYGPNNLNAALLVNDAEGWAVGDNATILRYARAW